MLSDIQEKDEDDKKYVLRKQVILILFLNLVAFLVMYLQTMEIKMLIMYLQVAAYIVVLQVMYRIFYKKASMLVVNNMCMLLSCGFIMLSRLDFEKAEKQFFIVVAGTVISLLVPVIIRKVKLLKDLTWLYGILGIILLLAVLALSKVTGGANLALEIGGISFQFSELVKITFVFFVAGILRGDPNFKKSCNGYGCGRNPCDDSGIID